MAGTSERISLAKRLPLNLGVLDCLTRYGRWQYFCTLTLRGDRGCTPKGVTLAGHLVFLREVAFRLGSPFPRLVWCLRIEHGEKNGRLHYHVLVSVEGAARKTPTIGSCYRQKNAWEILDFGGFADVRIYQPELHGAAYVVKCLGYRGTDPNGYEMRKFGMGANTILSDSLLRYLGGSRRRITLDGGEVGPWSEGCAVEPAKKTARCEVSKDSLTWFTVPTTRDVLPVNGMERTPTASGFGIEAYGDWMTRRKALTPAEMAELHEAQAMVDRKGR